jgi:hypothetical protein
MSDAGASDISLPDLPDIDPGGLDFQAPSSLPVPSIMGGVTFPEAGLPMAGASQSVPWTVQGGIAAPAGAISPAMYGNTAGVPQPGAGYDRGAAATGIFGDVLDGFDLQNDALALKFGGQAADNLSKFTGPIGLLVEPVQNSLQAAGDIADGEPQTPTIMGAMGKTAAGTGGTLLGSMAGGAALGSLAGPEAVPFGAAAGGLLFGLGVDTSLGSVSNQKLGNAISNAFLDKQNQAQ